MAAWRWLLVSLGVVLFGYAAFVGCLYVAGRRESARVVARFIPDCIVLFRRLLGSPLVPRRKKVILGLVVAYLATPIDLVPDFIPVAGYLDDAVLVAFALRHILRGTSHELIEENWPGPSQSRDFIIRLAGYESAESVASREMSPSPASGSTSAASLDDVTDSATGVERRCGLGGVSEEAPKGPAARRSRGADGPAGSGAAEACWPGPDFPGSKVT